MKKQLISRSLIALGLLLGVAWSCKTADPAPTAETCKLSAIDRGNGNKHSYTYDANGKITTMNREFDGSGSGNNISKYVYTFTYDAAGLLTKSVWTLDGKADGSETYTYTSGKISKTTYVYANGDKGVNNIKYNAAGQITEFTIESGTPDDVKQYFEYDANGITVKNGVSDLKNYKFFEVVYKPVGVAKSPEQLLAKYGLPYDVFSGYGWSSAMGGEGSTYESFSDDNGKLVSDGTGKITAVKANTKGYITEMSDLDNTTKTTRISKFTMIDCN